MRKFLFDSKSVDELHPSPIVSLPDGMPFVLDDDFTPVEEINTWLRSLPQRGCHSPRTWSGYADDMVAWASFLQERGKSVFDGHEALVQAVAHYREVRLQGDPDGPYELLGPSAWNRAVAAMENFYSWAVDERRIVSKPFRYKQVRVWQGALAGETTQKNLAKARAGSPLATMRHLEVDFADMFIKVGLGGELLDGKPDLAFRGRLAARNRALGHLVRRSGLRRQEFSNLLVWEAPRSLGPFSDYVALPVPRTIAKGAHARVTWATNEALDDVRTYIDLERAIAVEGSDWMPERPLHVEEPNERSGIVNGRRVTWAKLSIQHRRRLVGPNGGSALLFVSSNGSPVEENNWRYTFASAADRCREFSPTFPDVTPHMLRHTFAMETLTALTRGALSRAERLARVTGADPLLMAILRRNDPLLVLRDLLGHKHLSTTEVYLAAQDATTVLTDAELDLLEELDLAETDELDDWAS
ncbi:tyrosine-type recombinase/integrase [Leifsonia sp. Leaf264]|uniref:tyrosine-type recombinase/integrase n=1 Tax=Leifsonia sp. Leaf264 TaxID=1736314 RepID=UPI0006F72602|nr:site-specific integrase [Leifsonia sp. Leaf264]KQP01946.1 hypothetical protein ASF30_05175 [Leifsonia sp. Leaf264]